MICPTGSLRVRPAILGRASLVYGSARSGTRSAPQFIFSTKRDNLSSSGFIIFMPWVTLPCSRFRFCPLPVQEINSVVDPDMVETIENALRCYVRRNGKHVGSCTIVLRARHQQSWNIPREHWNLANNAAETLALACLAEQRFFEGHFSPHLNSTMFHLVGGIIYFRPQPQYSGATSSQVSCTYQSENSYGLSG